MTVALSNTPVLETERLVLRAPQAGDWPAWRAMMQTDRSEFIRSPGGFQEDQAWRGFGHMIGHWVLRGWGQFVFTRKGDTTALGATGPWYPAGWAERELGWSVWSEAAEGQGYAFEAARAARDHAIHTLGWNTAVSYINPANARSIALAERLGAVLDPAAALPDLPDWDGTLVFRHPQGEHSA